SERGGTKAIYFRIRHGASGISRPRLHGDGNGARQVTGNRSADILFRGQLHMSAMQLDEAFDQREAKARTGILPRRVALREAFENMLNLVLGNAFAIIAHADDEAIMAKALPRTR